MKNIIIGIGEVLWDIHRSLVTSIPDGRTLGGAPANFVFHCAQLGLDARIVSAVGEDKDGQDIVRELDKKGVRHLLVTVPDHPTGTVLATPLPNGDNHYEIVENVAYDHIDYSDELAALVPEARAVCFGTLAQRECGVTHDTVRKFLGALDSKEVLKVYDINIRPTCDIDALPEESDGYKSLAEVYMTSLRLANVLKINEQELPKLGRFLKMQEQDPDHQCRALFEELSNLYMVILTCGGNGSYVYFRENGGQTIKRTCSFVEIDDVLDELHVCKDESCDTVGAGDSFTAAFISGFIKNDLSLDQLEDIDVIQEIHDNASRVAAFVCTRQGAMPKLDGRLLF